MLTLGAGSLGLFQGVEADAAAKDGPSLKDVAPPGPQITREPVNVTDFQMLAKAALPQATYEYITSGSTDEITLKENVAAFQRLRILPPLLSGVDQVDTRTTVLKEPIAMPILLAPVAGQSLYHPQGILGSARAAASAQTILGVSSSAGHSIEEIAAVSTGPKWFQLYVPKDRGIARRLVERGVRYVQLFSGGAFGSPRINWDGHEDVRENHGREALRIDRPIAGLLRDLRQRGLLDETLVLFTTEFGRTPFAQSDANSVGAGRDHNQTGFSIWMAGGGVRGGFSYGSTDDVGWKAVEGQAHWHDVHATLLHLLGINHEELTFYHNGIRRRLTDVSGKVLHGILA